MPSPVISIYDDLHTNLVSTWAVGTVKAQIPSAVLEVNIWNNRAGTTAVSDLKDCSIAVYDSNGTTYVEDVAKDQWVEINVPSVDGNTTTWTAIGGTNTKDIRAMSGVTDFSIKGTTNDGTPGNSQENYCTCNFRINAPINSVPGAKPFKIRLTGYYT